MSHMPPECTCSKCMNAKLKGEATPHVIVSRNDSNLLSNTLLLAAVAEEAQKEGLVAGIASMNHVLDKVDEVANAEDKATEAERNRCVSILKDAIARIIDE